MYNCIPNSDNIPNHFINSSQDLLRNSGFTKYTARSCHVTILELFRVTSSLENVTFKFLEWLRIDIEWDIELPTLGTLHVLIVAITKTMLGSVVVKNVLINPMIERPLGRSNSNGWILMARFRNVADVHANYGNLGSRPAISKTSLSIRSMPDEILGFR